MRSAPDPEHLTGAGHGRDAEQDELPPDPGTQAIPDDRIRLWHYTPVRNVDSIRQHGLQRKYARGDAGDGDLSDPSAGVWASTRRPDDILDDHACHAAVVEFHAHPDEISQNADHPWHQDPQEWAKGWHHVIMRGDVRPSSIVAIHEPWHGAARYMRDDDPTLASYQWLKEHDQDDDVYGPYVRGLQALERQRETAPAGQTPGAGERPGDTWRLGLAAAHQEMLRRWERDPRAVGHGNERARFRRLISTAPQVQGPVYRGDEVVQPPYGIMPLDRQVDRFRTMMDEGATITFGRHTATSARPEIAGGFGHTVYEIHGARARAIGNSLHEAIMPPGKYRVTHVERRVSPARAPIDGATMFDSDHVHVRLEPLGWSCTARAETGGSGAAWNPSQAAAYHEDGDLNGIREEWSPGDRAHYEYHCLESPESSDAELWHRSHQPVHVLGPGDDEALDAPLRERLEEGMPRTYRIRFADGHEGTAWEDELLTHPKHYERPDPPARPKTAAWTPSRGKIQVLDGVLDDGNHRYAPAVPHGIDRLRAESPVDEEGHLKIGGKPPEQKQADLPPGEPLPVERGLWYRLHHKDAPFGPAHARSRSLDDPGPGLSGYSAFASPHHLRQYMEKMDWIGGEAIGWPQRRVISFRGREVGRGTDNEPLVMPDSTEPRERMSWADFQSRLRATPPPQRRWDPANADCWKRRKTAAAEGEPGEIETGFQHRHKFGRHAEAGFEAGA